MFLEKVLKNRVAKVTNDITDIFTDTENGKRFLLVLGRAGTGKSTLLRKLAKHSRKNIAIVAPTGIAAVNVGGETIHSFFKFKPGIMFEEASKNGQNTQNVMYEKLDLLIIDEISMVRADLLDSIDVFLRHARKKNEPFGGVQVVCFGDMYQLEPVVSNDEKDMLYIQYDSPYFFSSRVFNELLFFPSQLIEFVELTKVYRQTDEEFISLLDKIRKKKADEYDLYKINERFAEYVSDTMEGHIYLTTRNDSAARINTKNLELIPEPEYSYLGTTEGDFPDKLLPTDWDLKLKLGARVMLINNDTDKRWINGTLGYVSKLENDAVFVKLDNGNEHAVTRYTWSYYKYVYDKSQDKVIKQLIGSYTQFPLKLAWAITIHKSQGQTFDRAVIWLEGRAFANGQVYVALSRCRTLEGIVLNRPIQQFDIMTDDKVRKFLIKIRKYISKWRFTETAKIDIIREAIHSRNFLEITYINEDEELQTSVVSPQALEEENEEVALQGHDMHTSSEISIRVAQILELSPSNIKQIEG